MRSFLTALTIPVFLNAMLTSALVARNYGPKSDYTCPDKDYYGHPLASSKVDNGDLCCYYEDHKKYCSYDKKTGYLIADYDDGKCPYQAVCEKPPPKDPSTYTCPHKDYYGHPLDSFKVDNGDLCCYYEDHKKYCSYDEKTGKLVGDYDDGKCPHEAVCEEPPKEYTCPHKDNYGHSLDTYKVDNGDLCCYYEDHKKYCSYDKKTGKLVGDYDDGKCPYEAVCEEPKKEPKKD